MNRRELIAGAALSPIATAIQTEPKTPVEQLFEQWHVLFDEESRDLNNHSDEEITDPLTDRRLDKEAELIAAPSERATDVLRKIQAWTLFGEAEIEPCKSNRQIFEDINKFSGAT